MRAQEIFENRVDSPEFKALLTPAVIQLDKAFTENGFEIRIVGGAVRDLILGKAPKDIDMATTAKPQEAMDLLQSIGVRVEPTGLQHGTITAVIDGEPIEITTLRIDTNQDGRHADVEFASEGGCLDPALLEKFIDKGYNPDQDYSFQELLEAVRQINR